MSTLAELDIRVDSTQTERATKALTELAKAAREASEATKLKSSVETTTTQSSRNSTRDTQDATKEYDLQAKKLRELTDARKKLEESNMRTSDPEKYKRELTAIDATIGKLRLQGNAQEQLEAKWKSMEAAQLKSSERDKANTDSVISGLSKQMKAQIDYNRTVEDLNRARGLGSGKSGGISEAEYDTYKKLAQAQRDNTLAAIDGTKEQAKAQAQIDSVAASLGRAEKAQYLYAQRVKQITESSKVLGLTEAQTTALIAPHTAKLNEQLSAINSTAAAQDKFNSQLRSSVTAYDPVSRATDTFNSQLNVLLKGLGNGSLSVDQFNAALTRHRVALDQVKAAQPNSENSQAKQYQDAVDRLLPYNAQLRNLEAAERALTQAKASGKVVTEEEIRTHKRATDALAAERAEIDRVTQASNRRGNSAKQDAAALRGLPAQFTDVVVSLQGGQAPLTVLLQQGGQVKDMFGGVLPAIKAVSGALIAMITPATLVAGGLAAVAFGAAKGQAEVDNFNKAIISSGGYAGVSASQFTELRTQVSNVAGTASSAAEALTLMEASGKITGDMFNNVALAAVKMQIATGTSIKETVDDFASLGKDPVNAAIRLDEKYRFLTTAILEQAQELERTGQAQEATILLQDRMAVAAQEAADKIVDRAGYIERAWRGVKEVVLGVGDALAGIGRTQTAAEQLANLKKEQETIELSARGVSNTPNSASESILENNPRYKANKVEIEQLQQRVNYEQWLARLQGEEEQRRSKSIIAQESLNRQRTSALTPVQAAQEAFNTSARQFADITRAAADRGEKLTDQQIETYKTVLAGQQKKLKEALEKEGKTKKSPTVPVDTTSVTETKANIDAITREYDNYYKKISAIGATGVVSEEATFASQQAILTAQRKAVSDAYDSQIASIKKLQGVKGNNAAQNISLDNQLLRAQEAKNKADENLQAKQEDLEIKEKATIAKRTANIKSYAEALKESVTNIEEQGRRQVAALSQGDRQNSVNNDLASADATFAKGLRSLSKEQSGMDPVEYAAKLADLKKNHSEMTEAILKNDKNLKEAEGDWTSGVSKAYENYIDSSQNLAGQMSSVVTNAFSSMDDALTSFVTTGKISFSSLATSIIADMARIAVKQASSTALQSLFSIGMSLYSGGGNGLAAGSAGAVSSNLGASAAGYGSSYIPQAKGGAWTGGTQFFADGGAFTNSIVSTPTAFNTQNGRGVMGEAGPEAIVPLARSSDGKLGVRMAGGGGSSGSSGVNVNIYISESGDVSSDVSGDQTTTSVKEFGRQMGEIAAQKYQELMKRDLSDGGQIKTAINGR